MRRGRFRLIAVTSRRPSTIWSHSGCTGGYGATLCCVQCALPRALPCIRIMRNADYGIVAKDNPDGSLLVQSCFGIGSVAHAPCVLFPTVCTVWSR